jgi:hypothetical protein
MLATAAHLLPSTPPDAIAALTPTLVMALVSNSPEGSCGQAGVAGHVIAQY